jgi:hypothetical protein
MAVAMLPMFALACWGCQIAGVAANSVEGERKIEAAYAGLQNQRVGIWVWVDEGVEIDHPSVAPDVAGGLQSKLQQAADDDAKEVRGITWVKNAQILQYQQDHPELQSDSPEQIAAKLNVSRLIYVEIVSLSIHPNDSVDLSKGTALANLKVVEVAGGKATMAYTNDNISGEYPPKSPPEGMPELSDDVVYAKSVDALTTEMAKVFITHPADAQ